MADRPQDAYLRTDHLEGDLRGQSVRGGTLTLLVRGVGFFVRLSSLAILARLITKEDFGLVFAVAAVANLFSALKEMGLSTATQQRTRLDHGQVSNLFWINVGMSMAAAAMTASMAPVVVWAYGSDVRILPLVLIYAGMHVVDGLNVQHGALLRRQMRFGSIAVVNLVTLLMGRGAAVAVAWAGYGYWALVVMAAASKTTFTIATWIACGWRPDLPSRRSPVRSLLKFGGNLTGARLLHTFTQNADRVLLATFVGEAATGVFGNARRVLELPTQNITWPLTQVAFPALSRLQRHPRRFLAYYTKAIQLLATVGMPLVAFLFCSAEQIVVTVLGPEWQDAIVVFRVLAPAAMLSTVAPAVSWVYQAFGRTDRQVRWTMIASCVRLAAMGAGVTFGAVGVAAAISITGVALWIPGLLFCFHGTTFKLRHPLGAIWRPAACSIAAAGLLLATSDPVSGNGAPWIDLSGDLAEFAIAYLVCWLVVPGGRAVLRDLQRLAGDLRGGRATSRPAVTAPAEGSA